MELLYILQPSKGLVPPRVLGRSHSFPSKRGGLRAQTFGAIFSIRDSMHGKDKDKGNGRGKGKGKGKVFGK